MKKASFNINIYKNNIRFLTLRRVIYILTYSQRIYFFALNHFYCIFVRRIRIFKIIFEFIWIRYFTHKIKNGVI